LFLLIFREDNNNNQKPVNDNQFDMVKQLAAPIKIGAIEEAPVKKEIDSFFDVKRENITVNWLFLISTENSLLKFFFLQVRESEKVGKG
jgi:hypothetical protein